MALHSSGDQKYDYIQMSQFLHGCKNVLMFLMLVSAAQSVQRNELTEAYRLF